MGPSDKAMQPWLATFRRLSAYKKADLPGALTGSEFKTYYSALLRKYIPAGTLRFWAVEWYISISGVLPAMWWLYSDICVVRIPILERFCIPQEFDGRSLNFVIPTLQVSVDARGESNQSLQACVLKGGKSKFWDCQRKSWVAVMGDLSTYLGSCSWCGDLKDAAGRVEAPYLSQAQEGSSAKEGGGGAKSTTIFAGSYWKVML
jgi:hypothetical protein